MYDQHLAGFFHGSEDRFRIEWDQRADVDDFHVPVMLFLQPLGDTEAEMRGIAICDHAQVAARPADTAFPKGTSKSSGTKPAASTELYCAFGCEKDGKTLRTYAGAQQSCRIIGKRRIDDAGSRNGGQRPFNRLRVVEPSADITARCQAECQVRGELSVASPVFVCTFDILLDGRPEVVGKFGSFHHDMYFRVEAGTCRWPCLQCSLRQWEH